MANGNVGDYYERDQRLGSITTFDGIDIYETYNADVYSFVPTAGSVDATYQRKVSRSTMESFYSDFQTSNLEISCYVGGADKSDALMNVNGLIAAAQVTDVHYGEDASFDFDAILTSYSVTETGIEWYFDVSLTFAAVRHMPLKTAQYTGTSYSFSNDGATNSGIRLTIVPSSSGSNGTITLNDGLESEHVITLKTYTASYTYLIDGIDGYVRANGINSILDTDLTKFPKAYPGNNTINTSFSATVTVEYYPTFEI